MLSTQVLDRLSALNRETPPTPIVAAEPWRPAERTTQNLPSGEQATTAWGPYWRIEAPIEQVWPKSATDEELHPELKQLATSYPSGALYLDLETCGFAGAMVFLIGLLHHDGQSWRLAQLLARDYSEEKAALQALWNIARDKQTLVTFNGKTFDWPFVHDRSTLHHLGRRRPDQRLEVTKNTPIDRLERHDARPQLAHCDVLHHARRKWRRQLPNCKLKTLERCLCQRYRSADIAGRDIPAAYHDYVRTKDAWQMRSVLHHNALDLVTLLEVSLRAAVNDLRANAL
jgi:uncharacterized protein YprB with RNaseH-like and TPR domain